MSIYEETRHLEGHAGFTLSPANPPWVLLWFIDTIWDQLEGTEYGKVLEETS